MFTQGNLSRLGWTDGVALSGNDEDYRISLARRAEVLEVGLSTLHSRGHGVIWLFMQSGPPEYPSTRMYTSQVPCMVSKTCRKLSKQRREKKGDKGLGCDD